MKKIFILFLFFLFCPLSILWASYWSGEWSGRATERSNFTSIYGTLSLALQQTDSEYSLEEGLKKTIEYFRKAINE